MGQIVKQLLVTTMTDPRPNQQFEHVALFDADGEAVVLPTNVTGDDVPLTGYEIAVGADDLVDTDTVNLAFGKIEFRTADLEDRVTDLEALPEPTGADVLLTGYVGVSADDVEATDTVNAAIAKLEARIAVLEAA